MLSERARRLIKITALLFVLTAEIAVPVFWLPPGWVALASGFVGSVLLIIPPMRIELAKGARTRVRRLPQSISPEFAEGRKESYELLTKEIEEENQWDAYLLVLGGIFLAFYFILQIPYKLELVDKEYLTHELTKFQIDTIDPLRDRLDRLSD